MQFIACWVTSVTLQAMAYSKEDIIGMLDTDADGSYINSSDDDLGFEVHDPHSHLEACEVKFQMIVKKYC